MSRGVATAAVDAAAPRANVGATGPRRRRHRKFHPRRVAGRRPNAPLAESLRMVHNGACQGDRGLFLHLTDDGAGPSGGVKEDDENDGGGAGPNDSGVNDEVEEDYNAFYRYR